MDIKRIKALLDAKVEEFEHLDFIVSDPIQIPHLFTGKEDIEIAGFFAATIAWGNRNAIIKSCKQLLERMDYAPFQYIIQHQPSDLQQLNGFVHRTFNEIDVKYFVLWLQWFYSNHQSLEQAFFPLENNGQVKDGLIHFHNLFFSLPTAPARTRKHVSTPFKKSASKRLNMYLRWMIRTHSEVDFGLWQSISPAQLMLPLDIHTSTISRRLGLLSRSQNDWQAVEEVTAILRKFCPSDPVKYDYALFGMGVNGE